MARSVWDYIDWFKDTIIIPQTGIGSEADMTRKLRMLNTQLITPDESPLSDQIVSSAYERLNFDTSRGSRKSWVCADATCDMLTNIGIPWPKDKDGKNASSIDFVIDAFDGRGKPGKLFSKYSEDFQKVGPGELSRGDILILDVSGQHPVSYEVDMHGRVQWDTVPDPSTREYGYQKHMALITSIYEDGVEVVHDSGEQSPVYSKFYSMDFLNDAFDRAYRYIPDINDQAFSHLLYEAGHYALPSD
jgi:hypothetical protein